MNKISEAYPDATVVGCDAMEPTDKVNFKMVPADICAMPFADHSFDTVLCTHALEHVRFPQKALAELLRVTKKRLIVVVPRQREYKYTGDLHINYFPYMYSFKRFIGIEKAIYCNLGGDFLCQIDL